MDSNNDNKTFGNKAIDAVGSVSATYYKWRFYLSIIIAVILILTSIYLIFFQKDNKKTPIKATIKDSLCSRLGNRGTERTNCEVKVEYTYNGKKYSSTVTRNELSTKGDKITIYINQNKPNKPTTTKPGTVKMIGYALGVVAILMVTLSYFLYKLTKSHKGFATFLGVSNLFGSTI